MRRFVLVGIGGLLLTAVAGGCSSNEKGQTQIPQGTIQLPKQDPIPSTTAGPKGAVPAPGPQEKAD
jgi:hypothetical protein